MPDLSLRNCIACEGGIAALSEEERVELLAELDNSWAYQNADKHIQREFRFRNYYQTSAFVNAVIWIAHSEDHHPDIEFGYNRCSIRYSTHAVGGVTENDLICAAKINALLENFTDQAD